MNTLEFATEENDNYYDFNTLRSILRVSKSKLYRDLKKVEVEKVLRYKNQNLYNERTLFLLIEKALFEGVEKTENE
jgi:transcriptional antiterminator